jgi:hypothetical protein
VVGRTGGCSSRARLVGELKGSGDERIRGGLGNETDVLDGPWAEQVIISERLACSGEQLGHPISITANPTLSPVLAIDRSRPPDQIGFLWRVQKQLFAE